MSQTASTIRYSVIAPYRSASPISAAPAIDRMFSTTRTASSPTIGTGIRRRWSRPLTTASAAHTASSASAGAGSTRTTPNSTKPSATAAS